MVSEDSDQLLPGFFAVHRLSDLDDLQQALAGQVVAVANQLDAACELLEVDLLRGTEGILPEERNDDLQQILPLSHDETMKVLFVVVVPGVGEHLADPEELTQIVQARDALRPLRDGELVSHLIAGPVAFALPPGGLPDEADGEASFPVYKTNNPAESDQPFLLIVRTHHVVTAFRSVVWDTRSFQHMAECSARHYWRAGQRNVTLGPS